MTEGLPRITVVTPSYNQAAFLDDTIRSVLDQGYPNLEYFVLDAGSQDGSKEIIERHADRLAWWRSAPDDGQAAALKEGFARATGDILSWVNSDDLLEPGALQAVAATWQRHGGEVMIAGACQLFDSRGEGRRHLACFHDVFDEPRVVEPSRILDLARHWFPGEFFYQPEVFFPRRAYEAVGGVDPAFYYTMDYDLWVRLVLGGTPVVVIDRTLARYREHDQQKTADRGALYREMVATAHDYLEEVDLPDGVRAGLRRRNRLATYLPIREAYKLAHRFGAFR